MADDKALATTGSMNVTVVTPMRHVLKQSVEEITAHGSLGEFGVLPGHIPLLTMLDTGVLILQTKAGRQVYAHGPGYLEVGAAGHVEILVEQVANTTDIDANEAKSELESAEAEMKELGSTDDAEWKNLAARRDWAAAQLDALSR